MSFQLLPAVLSVCKERYSHLAFFIIDFVQIIYHHFLLVGFQLLPVLKIGIRRTAVNHI